MLAIRVSHRARECARDAAEAFPSVRSSRISALAFRRVCTRAAMQRNVQNRTQYADAFDAFDGVRSTHVDTAGDDSERAHGDRRDRNPFHVVVESCVELFRISRHLVLITERRVL